MNSTELRITARQWRDLEAMLFARTEVETKAFALAEPIELRGKTVLVVREVIPTPDPAYAARSAGGVVICEDFVRAILERCFEERLSLIDIHTHPWRSEAPWFSSIDDRADLRRYRYTHPIMHGAGFTGFRHASLVFAPGMLFQGRIWRPDVAAIEPVQRIRVLDAPLRFVYGSSAAAEELPAAIEALYDRQVRAFGSEGQAILRNLTVALVGAGGLGSQVAQGLALLGVGRLLVIDPDVVEASNANRLVGAFEEHFASSWSKVAMVADTLGRMLNPPQVVAIDRSATDAEVFPYLAEADVILGAVDAASVRVYLNRVAAATLTPYIDAGVGVKVEGGRPSSGGGQVQTIIPGVTPCLSCLGVTAPEVVQEDLSPEERAIYRRRGYIVGEEIKAPQVAFLNGVVANLQVTEFVKLVTGIGTTVPYVYYDLLGDHLPAIALAIDVPPRWDECYACGDGGGLATGARWMEVPANVDVAVAPQAPLSDGTSSPASTGGHIG